MLRAPAVRRVLRAQSWPLAALSSSVAALHTYVPAEGEKVLIGNPANGRMPPVHVSWTDVVGLDATTPQRLAAGRVLSMMDLCAARAAGQIVKEVGRTKGIQLNTATVGVTHTVFSSAILHGDAVRMEGRVVHCGGSSLGVYIRFFRRSPTTRMENLSGESFFTMVTMTKDLKAVKLAPSMELTDPLDIAMHYRYQGIRAGQKEDEREREENKKRILTAEDVDCPINASKPMHVTVSSTRSEANRIFFSAYLNNNNTVFGGELMAWMELHATHCARMFTGNRNVYTIGMHSVSFREPIFSTDWVTLQATVVYVRNTTMEVDVKLIIERSGEEHRILSDQASFVLINENEIGQKANIPTGLDLRRASQEELHSFNEGRWRYSRSAERAERFQKLRNQSAKLI